MHTLYMCSSIACFGGTHLKQSLTWSFAPVICCYDGCYEVIRFTIPFLSFACMYSKY